MNFDKLEQAIIRYRESLARFRDDREALRALGVTDLPGDAQNSSTSSNGSPPAPALPDHLTWAMIQAAQAKLKERGWPGICNEAVWVAIDAAAAVAPKPAPPPAGNLPPEPTNEMLRRAVDTARDVGEPVQAGTMHAALSSALAVAPRAEIPEVTEEYRNVYHRAFMDNQGTIYEDQLAGLRAVRARLIERMGAKS